MYYQTESIHFDHTGIEVGALLDLVRMEADAAYSNNIEQADKQGSQTTKSDNLP